MMAKYARIHTLNETKLTYFLVFHVPRCHPANNSIVSA